MYKCVTCPSNVWAETRYTGLKWIKEHDDLCCNIVKAGNQRSPIQILTSSNLHTFLGGLPEKHFFSYLISYCNLSSLSTPSSEPRSFLSNYRAGLQLFILKEALLTLSSKICMCCNTDGIKI